MTPEQQAKLEAIHKGLQGQVASLTSGQQWKAMLDAAARFHDYSANNVLLVMLQKPDATRVAGFHTWKALGRSVNKGEHGIAILAPTKRTIETENETTGEKGKVQKLTGFRVVYVFDISQTSGKELPEVRPTLLEGGDVAGLWAPVVKVIEAQGYKVTRGDCGGANGWSNPTLKEVRVRDDVSDAQAAKTLVHEAGHVLLGHVDDMVDYSRHRGIKEVEAESVAYVVMSAAGVDTAQYSAPYVGIWQGADAKALEKTASRVVATAHQIIEAAGLVQSQAPSLEGAGL